LPPPFSDPLFPPFQGKNLSKSLLSPPFLYSQEFSFLVRVPSFSFWLSPSARQCPYPPLPIPPPSVDPQKIFFSPPFPAEGRPPPFPLGPLMTSGVTSLFGSFFWDFFPCAIRKPKFLFFPPFCIITLGHLDAGVSFFSPIFDRDPIYPPTRTLSFSNFFSCGFFFHRVRSLRLPAFPSPPQTKRPTCFSHFNQKPPWGGLLLSWRFNAEAVLRFSTPPPFPTFFSPPKS